MKTLTTSTDHLRFCSPLLPSLHATETLSLDCLRGLAERLVTARDRMCRFHMALDRPL